MTNTRNTPIEALEHAYPFRARAYELRAGSGGSGIHHGGDGVVREIELLAPSDVTLVGERRTSGPWGTSGGGSGAAGLDVIDGRSVSSKVTLSLGAGSVIRVETPGGGGWGNASER
jgi:N-methylhydantoinase B